MKKFMDENFLLSNDTAVELYHKYAKEMPIIDYHCHLNPQEIYENKQFKNITEVWLYGDHYKWRAMRSNGIDERFMTGDATDYEKFMAWVKTLQIAIGNPLYHWTHLELQRFFGIHEPLNEKTAESIWNKANEMLQREDFRARDLIKKSNVKALCTTDDPVDSLEYHIKLKEDKDFDVKVLPTFRPEKAIRINKKTFIPWINKLGEVTGKEIQSYDDLLKGLRERVKFFHSVGCRISDHALDSVFYKETSYDELNRIFIKGLSGEEVSKDEEKAYTTGILKYLGETYSEFGWTMQLHIAAMRDNNTRMFNKKGADIGFDSINDEEIAYPL